METELKEVVVKDGKIINVGKMYTQEFAEDGETKVEREFLPEGATLETREMFYTNENGWREVGWTKEPTVVEKLQADLEYISIMAGVNLYE